MEKLKRTALALAAATLLCTGAAQAALFDRGGGLIYDDVLDITWLADANYAQTSGYDADGMMSWVAANTWVANLSYGGYDDWRLPTALNRDGTGPCFGVGCVSSEMGYMFYNNLRATSGNSILSGSETTNLALFTNLQSDLYWSGTAYAPNPAVGAWYFATDGGNQSLNGNLNSEFYVWAVRSGDVAAPIPEPEVYAMLLAGLSLLGVAAKRRRRSSIA